VRGVRRRGAARRGASRAAISVSFDASDYDKTSFVILNIGATRFHLDHHLRL
jgi:hypothetical protein